MRARRETRRAAAPAALAGVVLALAVPGAGGANPPSSGSVPGHREASLGTRAHQAVLTLYSLDTQLARTQAQLASLQSRLSHVRAEQHDTATAQQIARRVWRDSVETLGAHLRALYEQDPPDAVAILFGASSIDDAMARLDALERSLLLNRQTVSQTRTAQRTLRTLQRRLATRAAELETLVAQARDSVASLERARAARAAFLARLRRERAWSSHKVVQIASVAQHSADRTQFVAQPGTAGGPPAPAAPAAAPAVGGQTLTVTATGYSLAGTTATGIPVGPGVVAVDPSVIPLGTRMTIPGYGEGFAADTGGAVHGATIDLWFATPALAMGWGRRTVTITLH